MTKPECLHIPPLYENKEALITWENTGDNTTYIIERVFNESFTQASSGYTWDNIDTTEISWHQHESENLTWKQIDIRPNKGQNWETLDYFTPNWSRLEAEIYSWKQFEEKEVNFEIFRGPGFEKNDVERGRTWLELDEQHESWNYLDTTGYSWHESELETLPGLTWDSIEARWLAFDKWDQKNLTFDEWDIQESVRKHQGTTDTIPIGAESAMYRIKTSNSNGDESNYLTTSEQPIIPIFYRRGEMQYPVRANQHYRILIKAEDVYGLELIRMNLRYDSHILELTNMAAHSTKRIIRAGNYPEERLRIYSMIPGKVWFQSTKQLTEGECYSGVITLIEFQAKKAGLATISLS